MSQVDANRASAEAASSGPVRRRVRRLQRTVSVLLVTVLVASLAIFAVAVAAGTLTIALVGGVNAITFALLLALLRRGRVEAVGLLAGVSLTAVAAFAMWFGDGLQDVATLVLPVALLVGSFLLHRHYYVLLVAFMLLCVGVVGLGEIYRWLPSDRIVQEFPLDLFTAPILLLGVAVFVYSLTDSLYASLDAAEASEQNYREIFDATGDAVFIHDAQSGQILDVNETMLRMYGYQRSEVLGLNVAALSAPDSEFTQARAMQYIERAEREGPQVFEWHARRADGSAFWVEVALRSTAIGGQGRVLAAVRDVDDRRRMQEQVRQADKMQAVGQLAGGVAHDFNNQLAGILGFTELMRNQLDGHPQLSEYADGIMQAARRAADLTSKLLAFARRGRRVASPVDLHTLVDEVVLLLSRSIDPRIRIRRRLDAENPTTVGDPTELQNALLNIGVNARDAMPAGGELVFRTDTVAVPRKEPGPSRKLAPGKYVRVQISDTGVGMDGETQRRVFEPFFTTKEMGNGMGLAAVYGTVDSHHGSVDVHSVPGEGTTFSLYLPVRESALQAVRPSQAPALQRAEGLRVLVAEDEPTVARVTRLMLERLGCTVHVVGDGAAAVQEYQARSGAFDLVLLDLTMPKLDGVEAFREIRRIDPDARVVMTSGYSAESKARGVLAKGAAGFIRKPFQLSDLAEVVAAAAGAMQCPLPGAEAAEPEAAAPPQPKRADLSRLN